MRPTLVAWFRKVFGPEPNRAARRRRKLQHSPALELRRLEDRRVLSVDVVDGQTLTIAENSLDDTVVGTPTVTQTTPGALTYSITAGNESNAFLIDPVSGEIRVADGSQLDFETKPIWELTVEAFLDADSTQRDQAVVQVQLSDVSGPQSASISGAATLGMVDGRITVTAGGTTLFRAGAEDVTTLTINGSAGNDTLTVDFTGGNPLPAGGLTFDGPAV